MRTPRVIGWGLLALAAGIAANSLLGPLAFGTIDYRFGPSMTNQGIGLDAVVLLLVTPIAALAGILTLRGHPAGPVLALGPVSFAVYMLPQYVIGPEYGLLPGNNERFFGFHLTLLVLASMLLVGAWSAIDGSRLASTGWSSNRRLAWLMAGVAAFILLRWAPALLALTAGDQTNAAYRDNPTAFLLIALLDLALVVPAAVAAAIGLRQAADWARTVCYLVIGWFTFVPASVAAMAITMQLRDDPQASAASATFLTTVAGLSLVAAAALYRPLLTQVTETPAEAERSELRRLALEPSEPETVNAAPTSRGVLSPDGVDLFWLPLGAGERSGCVRWNGRLFETVTARLTHRTPCDLYHSALEVRVDGTAFSIEMTPAWGNGDDDRGVVATGPVGMRLLGRSRFFRYEVRRWRGGTIPDRAEAVGGPRPLTDDVHIAQRVIDIVTEVPTATWGRDELATGDMWNSNSLTAWLLSRSGIRAGDLTPPSGGRAPGWTAGLVVADRQVSGQADRWEPDRTEFGADGRHLHQGRAVPGNRDSLQIP